MKYLTDEVANQCAGVLLLANESPYSKNIHSLLSVAGIDSAEFAEFWELDVSATIARIKRERSLEQVPTTDAIREYMRGKSNREISVCDLSQMARVAAQGGTKYKPAYEAPPVAGARLKLKEAVCYSYTQEAYADTSLYAIPATVAEGADIAECNRNLNAFFRAAGTHNGYAGSGCTYSGQLVQGHNGEYFVKMECRASISD